MQRLLVLILLLTLSGCGGYNANDPKVAPKWGVIDTSGNYILTPQFREIGPFSEGLAVVRIFGDEAESYGYIDQSGRFVIKPRYTWATPFQKGIAQVGKGKERFLINREGKIIGTPTRPMGESATTRDGQRYKPWEESEGYTKISGEDKPRFGKAQAFIDEEGEILGNKWFAYTREFSEGLAAVVLEYPKQDESCAAWNRREHGECSGKWGYIDTSAAIVIPPQFDQVGKFSDGLAPVCLLGNDPNCDNFPRWGFINRKGKIVIQPKWYLPYGFPGFNDGLAMVGIQVPNNQYWKLWGFIDKAGNFVVKPKYKEARPFKDGYSVVDLNDKWGAIDRRGEYIVKPQFGWLRDFSEGKAAFVPTELKCYSLIANNNDCDDYIRSGKKPKWGFINTKGKVVIPAKWDGVSDFSEDRASVRIGEYPPRDD